MKKKQAILSNKDFYGKAEAVDHYSTQSILLPKEQVAFLFLPNKATILDLGCGAGRTTSWLKQKGYDVIGLDIAFNMVKQAHDHQVAIPFLTGDATHLGFRDNSFDVVIFSFNGIDYISPYIKRLAALKEIRRVLKKNGLFIFSSHNHCIPRDMEGILPFMQHILKKNRSCFIDSMNPWGTIKLYLTTPYLQQKELSDNGFEVIDWVPRRILRPFKNYYRLIGLLDSYVYYICKPSQP